MAKRKSNWRWVDWLYVFTIVSQLIYIGYYLEQILKKSAENTMLSMTVLQVVVGLVIATLPIVVERFIPYRFPEILYAVYLIFVYCSILLGTGLHFYSRLYYWDKFLHVLSAGLLAGLGYTVFNGLISKQLRQSISALLMSLFAATFGSTIGILWEFYEFTGDRLLGLNMQRYMLGGQLLRGQAALVDTMGDLLADVLGSCLIALIGYFCIKHNRNWLNKLTFTKK
ncbi:Rnf-Nqr domain containing protein [Latilactobacillus graminis]|nr:Rnf-Nqr domain containing protein [Latilactobacillus graminis]